MAKVAGRRFTVEITEISIAQFVQIIGRFPPRPVRNQRPFLLRVQRFIVERYQPIRNFGLVSIFDFYFTGVSHQKPFARRFLKRLQPVQKSLDIALRKGRKPGAQQGQATRKIGLSRFPVARQINIIVSLLLLRNQMHAFAVEKEPPRERKCVARIHVFAVASVAFLVMRTVGERGNVVAEKEVSAIGHFGLWCAFGCGTGTGGPHPSTALAAPGDHPCREREHVSVGVTVMNFL